MSDLVRLERVGKWYGSGLAAYEALHDVSLTVGPGELASIIGPSGSGKTTLLNLIAGLEMPSSGRVFIRGHDLAELSEAARCRLRLETIGIVFQGFHLFPALTAAENVAWPLELKRAPRARVRETVRELLDRVRLADRSHRKPSELSGGEQQRVAIARALACDPALVLADEPTGNLDGATGAAVLELLEEICRERGATVLMVTHRTDLDAAFLGRTIELRDGRLHADHASHRGAA